MSNPSCPIYRQIAEELRQNLQTGIYKPGDRLPTEEQLSRRFGVNRHTLRRAVGELRAEGLLRADQGRGTFVADSPISYPITKRVRYAETLKTLGRVGSIRVLQVSSAPASDPEASALGIPVGDPVAVLERLGLSDEQPIYVASSYFPLRHFADLLDQLPTVQSISRLFSDHYHCDHLRRSTRLSARVVKPADARWLELPLNAPILLAESLNVDQHQRGIEYGVTRFRGDRMELIFENEL